MRYYHSAGIVLYRIKNGVIEYLLLHYLSGHWDFPKGKIEAGETKQQAALRELAEETGLTAELHEPILASCSYYFTDYGDGVRAHKTVDYFIGKAHDGEVRLSDEHIGFEWLPYEQALKRLTFEKGMLVKAHEYLTK